MVKGIEFEKLSIEEFSSPFYVQVAVLKLHLPFFPQAPNQRLRRPKRHLPDCSLFL